MKIINVEENRKAWIDALRSGEYEQGFGQLNAFGRYCCLGVACEVLGIDYDPALAYPPTEVYDEMGITWENAVTLACKNDQTDPYYSFIDIANIIENREY